MKLALGLLVVCAAFGQYPVPGGSGAGGSGTGVSYCADATGSTTTYTCPTATPCPSSYTAGVTLAFVPQANGAGGATTVNVCALGAKSIKLTDGTTNPTSSTLAAGSVYTLTYDGTVFRVNPGGPAGSGCTRTTVTTAYTGLTGQTTPYAVSLGAALSAGHALYSLQIIPTIQFTASGGMTSLTVELGDGTTSTAYAPPIELKNAVAASNLWANVGASLSLTSSHNVTATFRSTGGALSTLTAGSVTIYLCTD